MMMVLQRMSADHRLTYGDLSVLNMMFITLEPSLKWRRSNVPERIPAGRYMLAFRDTGELEVMDVPERENVFITTGNSVSQTEQNILVGINRAAQGMIEYSQEAYEYIVAIVRDVIDSGEECFIDVRDGS